MDAQKLSTIKALDGGDDFYANPGKILGLYILVKGTNKVGQVGTPADVGRFITERDGNQKQNVDFKDLQKIMNTRSGISILESVDGGAFLASAFMPFFEAGFPNCMNVIDKEELNIEYQPAANVDAVFADLSIEVWMKTASYDERYEFLIGTHNANYGAAVDSDPRNLGRPNITNIFIDDAGDIMKNFALEQSGKTVVSTATYDLLRAMTLQENQIEDETFDLVKISTTTPGDWDTLKNYSSIATLSASGAGNIRLILCSINY
ncbi:MAG TPA: hypothetical protein VFG39_01480 [Balneolaceae bacterium]|nr:hypothetical protein [Balneolaceae bacterium]